MGNQFHEKGFAKRFTKLGDQAEGIFEDVYPQGYVRFGLNRPPIQLGPVPPFVRFTPDYLTSKGLVEVQGFGRDQTAKFKVDKLDALTEWHRHFRVDFFLWDSHHRRYGWVRFGELDEALKEHGSMMQFHEGNSYFALRAKAIPVIEWLPHGEPLGAGR